MMGRFRQILPILMCLLVKVIGEGRAEIQKGERVPEKYNIRMRNHGTGTSGRPAPAPYFVESHNSNDGPVYQLDVVALSRMEQMGVLGDPQGAGRRKSLEPKGSSNPDSALNNPKTIPNTRNRAPNSQNISPNRSTSNRNAYSSPRKSTHNQFSHSISPYEQDGQKPSYKRLKDGSP